MIQINWKFIFMSKKDRDRLKTWKPMNMIEMGKAYEPHMKDALAKIENHESKTGKTVPIIGISYDDYPPSRGVVIKLDIENTSKAGLKEIKDLVENDYVTVERQEIPRFL